jgi:hypothetical protein
MSLTVHSDPQEPAGGFAFFEVPEGSVSGETVPVAIFDAYGERWLAASEEAGERIGIGDPHWQAERFEFGPYAVYSHQGAQWVRVGPEIVNKLEEYLPLKIEVAGRSYDVVWPDDVPPRAGAAVLGGLRPIARENAQQEGSRLVGKVTTPPETEVDTATTTDESQALTDETVVMPVQDLQSSETSRSGGLLVVLLLILALSAAGAAAWFFWPDSEPMAQSEPAPAPEPAPEPAVVAAPEPAAASDPCTAEALRGTEGGYAAIEAALRGCGASVSPDLALSFVEEFAARDEGAALLLLGTLYDAVEEDPQIESDIGLRFDPDDARAAEYYARARDAGEAAAAARLEATCGRLRNDTSTLARGAYDDFCG